MQRAMRWMPGLVLLLASAAPASAFTIEPGEALEVPFTLTGPAAGADTLTFNLVSVVAIGVTTLTVELYDGTTLLATASGVPIAGIAGFADVASGWTTNRADADLASVRDGTIAGRIRVLPNFAGAGVLEADVSAFTSLLVGNGTAPAQLVPIADVVSVGEPSVVPAPEPALGLLLAAAALRLRRRAQ
jgi:MYXO-CTERM domain-containing protein